MFYDIECEDAMGEEVDGDDGDLEGELIIKVRSGINRPYQYLNEIVFSTKEFCLTAQLLEQYYY